LLFAIIGYQIPAALNYVDVASAKSSPEDQLPRPAHAFKEWALICESIFRGETSLIFRKGGIAEGRSGFHFRFGRFFLYPTFFHAQAERLRSASPNPPQETDPIIIKGFVQIECAPFVTDLASLVKVESLHQLTNNVINERYNYSSPNGLYVAFLRAFRLLSPWAIPFQRTFGGCRSWIELPEPPNGLRAQPVLSEKEHETRRSLVASAITVIN
jgi:hypothetical protein